MNKLLARLALVGALLAPIALHATPISGTFSFNLNGVTVAPPGGPLYPASGINSISFTSATFPTAGVNSTPVFPDPLTGTISGSSAIYPHGPDGGQTSASPFTLIFGDYGTFVETSDPFVSSNSTNQSGTLQSLGLELDGIFTPGTAFPGYTGGDASIILTINEAGKPGSYSGSGTFVIEPNIAATPEPSSLIFLGTGLIGAVGVIRRRMV